MDSNGETEFGLLIRIARSAGQAVWSDGNRFQIHYGNREERTWITLSADRPITGNGALPGLADGINCWFAKKIGSGFVPSWLKEGMTSEEIAFCLEVTGF